ncbi:TRAP transporter substrate-binding protein DctP [Chloroflexota bacterium]
MVRKQEIFGKSITGIKVLVISVSLVLALLIVFVVPIVGCAPKPPEKQVLTLASGWSPGTMANVYLEKLVDRLNSESTVVNIDYKGGPEVVPNFGGFDYLKKGVVDMWFATGPYYAGVLPEASATMLLVASPAEEREAGWWDLYDTMHREVGVTALGQLWRGERLALFLNERIDKADLTGLKLRATPITGSPVIEALGGSTVVTPFMEIYTAMETGIVDGFVFPYGTLFVDMKWHEVTKYAVKPSLPMQTSAVLLARLEAWEGLSDKAREEIMDIILELEPQSYEFYQAEAVKVIQALVDEGQLEFIELPPAEAQKFLNIGLEAPWQEVVKLAPEYGPKLKEIANRITK